MRRNILTDSGFWIGLLDPKDPFHTTSATIADLIKDSSILFPWPCLYEVISTRMVRRRERMLLFEEWLTRSNIILLPDDDYKEEALKQVFLFNRVAGYSFSLTDSVIREILKDVNVKVHYLVTYNLSDFEDICDQRLIEIIHA